jgi:heterotetrameric sarcosine oxidase delta subunit
VDEFSAGGELTTRPARDSDTRSLHRALYMRRNVAGPQVEWWFHTQGCREWFQAERDTRSNEVLRVGRPGEVAPAQPGATVEAPGP